MERAERAERVERTMRIERHCNCGYVNAATSKDDDDAEAADFLVAYARSSHAIALGI